jgi:aspartate racemase
MRSIGLIGGMSWESTAVYYRQINEMVREAKGGLASADILLHSLDFESVVAHQKAGRWDLAAQLLAASGRKLAAAGADCVLICTNTMHLVSEPVEEAAGVPLLDIIEETGRTIADAGYRKPLLLATRNTMEHGFYGERMQRAAGISPIVPDEAGRALVHSVIFDELCAGVVRDSSRAAMTALIEKARSEGADCVILGCTEICLLLDPDALPLPGFDSTRIHARAAVDFALGARQPRERAAA